MCGSLWQATKPAACCQLQIVFTQAFPPVSPVMQACKNHYVSSL